jgi:membrane protease YdiL (CAAX protease family)
MEELGWTGFAVPKLRLRYGMLTTGVIAGALWGAWHLLTNDLWGGAAGSGDIPLANFLALNGIMMVVGQLTAFRILMVWMYERTGSLLLVMLMHASLVFSTFVLGPAGLAGAGALIFPLAVGTGMWVTVAALLLAREPRFSRRSVRMRTA